MTGTFIRLQLYTKRWLTSYYALTPVVLIFIVAMIVYNMVNYDIGDFLSLIYEKISPILLVLLLQWCFSIDMDSGFFGQVLTYPLTMRRYLLERIAIAFVIFTGYMSIVALVLTIVFGNIAWQGILFTLPLYLAIIGLVVLGTIIAKHSLGGLIVGIILWMIILFGAEFLQQLNPVLLIFQNIIEIISGETTIFASGNRLILLNRLFYIAVGLVSYALAYGILVRNRKAY